MTAKFDQVKVGDELLPYVHERVDWARTIVGRAVALPT
jgi:hypothetical protein